MDASERAERAEKIPRLRKANKNDIAVFFKVSLPTVSSWLRNGMPIAQEGSPGTPWIFDLLEVAEWRFIPGAGHTKSVSPDKMSPKEKLDYWRAAREESKHKQEQGKLIPVAEVEQRFAELYKSIAQAIEVFPDRMEREEGATPHEVVRLQKLGDSLREVIHTSSTT